MKLTKKSNKFKSRIVSLAAVIALILCAVLTLGNILPDRIAHADDTPTPTAPAAKTTDGIRFVQVAAGYDFAIGLTYDRKLYGWSTKEERNTDSAATLGDYYTENPTEIKVTFRQGPSNTTYRWNDTGTSTNYHTPTTDDKIKSIAATGTTAAFVTENGFIYTWGVDTDAYHDVDHDDDGGDHYLLLRDTGSGNGWDAPWYVPYIINYYYYGASDLGGSDRQTQKYPIEQMIPSSETDGYSSLAAGEYNYIFMFIRNYQSGGNLATTSSGNMYHTYVWGSALYNATNFPPVSGVDAYSGSYIEVQQNYRKIFNTFITDSVAGTNMTAVAGGYTVGINNYSSSVSGGTSLALHGKNFIMTQGVTSSGSDYAVTNTAKLMTVAGNSASLAWDGKKYLGAIAGSSGGTNQDGYVVGQEPEKYYARQAGNYKYTVSQANFLINSQLSGTGSDNQIAQYKIGERTDESGQKVDIMEDALKPARYAVSLGNDIGYGIANNKLYGWGDNANGQLVGQTGNKDEPTPLIGSVNFTSVAAGKQRSPEEKGVRAFFCNEDTISGSTFDAKYKNSDEYITGALAQDGTIYAWTKGMTQYKQLTFVGDSNNTTARKENFAAVYSGYGEILYAVTVSGKLVKITPVKNASGVNTDFEQYVYDDFYYWEETQGPNNQITSRRVKVDNWKVDTSNRVVFTPSATPTAANPAPEFDTAVFYVWSDSIAAAAAVPEEGGEAPLSTYVNYTGSGTNNSPYVSAPYKPLVSENKIGDAYRIIGLTAADASINYLKAADKYDSDIDNLDANNYAPKFYYVNGDNNGDQLMTPKQQQNMFTFREVYGANGEGVGISIKPLQSSKGKTIRAEFWIARYNSYSKFSNSSDTAIYYDYKRCFITFTIADTATVVKYTQYNSANANKCNIPLLDPNNPYNRVYSVAVQDVSTGVDEFIKFLTGNDSAVNPAFKAAVMTEMKKDIGFPNSDNVAKGDLTYYLNDEDLKKYNYVVGESGTNTIGANDGIYQHLFEDRDSDRITLAVREGDVGIMASDVAGAIVGEFQTITVRIEYTPTSYGISGTNANVTAEGFGPALLKLISTEFDNRYGLHHFQYTTVEGKNYLSFQYDVVRFTAEKATGVIGFTGNVNDPTTVKNYNTVNGQPHATASFMSYTLNKYKFTDAAGYEELDQDRTTPSRNNSNLVHVFAQASLRLKSDLVTGTTTDKNGQAAGTKNTYTETHTNTQTEPFFVGDTKTIRLSDYVNNIGSVISFSFNNKTDSTSLAGFSNQFKDFSGHNMRVVTLSGNTILVHPTTAAPINFTVEVQRFANMEKTRIFKNGDDVDEKIYLTFNFNNIVGFNMTARAQALTEYTITKTTVVDLFGEGNVTNANNAYIDLMSALGGSLANDSRDSAKNAYAELKANVQIFGLESSEKGKPDNERLFNVTDPQSSTSNKTQFTITPRRSGSGTIVFSANVYDKSLTFKLTINVSAITELDESKKISLIDYEYIPVSELDEVLRSANSFNTEVTGGVYRILHKDVAGAIYFEDEEGNTGLPPFIDNVIIERGGTSNATIRLKANNSSTSQSKTYKMYVRYTNAPEGVEKYEDVPTDKSIIQVVIPISSGKVKLQSAEGGDLVATIDCREPKKGSSSWLTTEGSHLETKVTINLSYLLDRDNTVGADKCTIFLLSADSAATKYFQYDKSTDEKSIQITPKLNTKKNYELSVSVYNDSDKTTKVLTFEISIKGILTELPVMTNDDGIIGYGNIWLYSAAIVFGVLFIIFLIRFIVYMRRRAKQRAIIKRNQELIRLRDRMHGKANAASREQLVKSKLKMEDPKYAKMFNDMRKDKEEESGVALVNSDLAATADKKSKKKKKKGGKKSVAELKAELAAKKAAFAAAQAGNAQPVNPFATEVPIDAGFVAPDAGYATDGGFAGGGFADGGGYAADGGFADGGYAADGGFADGN
ncbi:MAG: hypothetical protein K2F90_04070, partial [Clostridiales bacterium]|nr:hypothetical protein [Clostridiales bacterium]